MKRPLAAILLLSLSVTGAHAGPIGHYAGGLPNIRDIIIPEAGSYALVYNYFYQSGRINDRNGKEVNSITLGSNPGYTLNVNPDLNAYLLGPSFIWVTDLEIIGGRYGAFVLMPFQNTSVGADLETETGAGLSSNSSQFSIGDMFFQPLWLGWSPEHFDLSVGWGFYAPTGKYNVDTYTFPVVGNVRVADVDNLGLGFWTNQFQGTAAWYPWLNKATAVVIGLTYEVHSEKQDFDLTPGQSLTLNWGISQYLPLTKDQKYLAEVGPAGYDTWQVSNDSGSNAANGVRDQVHGVGFQTGFTAVDQGLAINFHYFYEVASQDRFQGHVFGLSFAKKL